jgi:hypothetical protein
MKLINLDGQRNWTDARTGAMLECPQPSEESHDI